MSGDNWEMKKAFTLVEILIVVAILGILAAIVLPTVQGHVQQARESAAKDNLRILRNTIELYTAQHNGVPPGYPNGDTSAAPDQLTFIYQLCWRSNQSGEVSQQGGPGYDLGPYLRTVPRNPFNDAWGVKMIGNSEEFPAEATGYFAYIYKPATKQIRLDWPGTDSAGVAYFDY